MILVKYYTGDPGDILDCLVILVKSEDVLVTGKYQTCDSSKSAFSILSKLTSEEIELQDIENKRKLKYQ